MALIHMTKSDYVISQWSGGTTTQVAIAPDGAVYADRDFLWRISSATVDLEESDFTALPDYHRWISTLEGGMKLTHENGAPIQLAPYQVHQFDGGVDTHSWGKCTDFNLMLRKGKAQGQVRSLRLAAGESRSVQVESAPCALPSTQLVLFCGQGSAVVTLGSQSVTLAPSESIYLKEAVGVPLTVTASTDAAFMIAEMQF